MKINFLMTFFLSGLATFVFTFGGGVSAETLLERGTYLMNSIVACGNCHTPGSLLGTPDNTKELAGGTKFDEKPFTAYAPNITPDKETGIGSWTDDQIFRAIRQGIRPDGSIIGPPMPAELYTKISDRDVRAIIAYLRSVKPVRNKVPKSVYRIPLPKNFGPPVKNIPDVPRSDKVRYGAYLAGPLGHCIECHTPFNKPGHRDFENQLGAGGFRLEGPFGVSISANITPHKATGIGGWTDRQIKTAVQVGYSAKSGKMFPPMAYHFYKNIRPADMEALIAYLRSIKPVRKKRKFRHEPPVKK